MCSSSSTVSILHDRNLRSARGVAPHLERCFHRLSVNSRYTKRVYCIPRRDSFEPPGASSSTTLGYKVRMTHGSTLATSPEPPLLGREVGVQLGPPSEETPSIGRTCRARATTTGRYALRADVRYTVAYVPVQGSNGLIADSLCLLRLPAVLSKLLTRGAVQHRGGFKFARWRDFLHLFDDFRPCVIAISVQSG